MTGQIIQRFSDSTVHAGESHSWLKFAIARRNRQRPRGARSPNPTIRDIRAIRGCLWLLRSAAERFDPQIMAGALELSALSAVIVG